MGVEELRIGQMEMVWDAECIRFNKEQIAQGGPFKASRAVLPDEQNVPVFVLVVGHGERWYESLRRPRAARNVREAIERGVLALGERKLRRARGPSAAT